MRYVEDHAEIVDLVDRLAAKRREPAMTGLIGRRIRPAIRCEVCGRDRADTVLPQFRQQLEAFFDRLRSLNRQDRGELSFAGKPTHLGRSFRQSYLVRIVAAQFKYGMQQS